MKIGFILFPNITQLDFTGPIQILSRLPDAEVHLVAADLQAIKTDCFSVLPTITFKECPQLDLLCVPGGFGVEQAIQNTELVEFVRNQAKNATYVTSVCTGSFVLGVAGLLEGKKATTHWAYHRALEKVGAIPIKERVVIDGNVITGGGVTAGIDFALVIAKQIAGETLAQTLQLGFEYNPSPPFNSGHPDSAPEEIVRTVTNNYASRLADFTSVVEKVRNQ